MRGFMLFSGFLGGVLKRKWAASNQFSRAEDTKIALTNP
jgi:hypothetical protein